MPETCAYVISHGKRDFADVVKYIDMGHSGFYGWSRYNHKGTSKREAVSIKRCDDGINSLELCKEGSLSQGRQAAAMS